MFDLLCRWGSPDFVKYLRAYDSIPRPKGESLETSCELADGIREDRGRLAIFNLQRQDVLNWIAACQLKIPSVEDLVFGNTIDECFMIGLADYPSKARGCRLKIYNEYGTSKSLDTGDKHAAQLFSLLDIPDYEFKKDFELFKKIKIGAVEWDGQQRAMIKIYFGDFDSKQLLGRFSGMFLKEELLCYGQLLKKGLLPKKFHFCIRYSRKEGRSLKIELNCQTRKVVPYLDMFDQRREAAKFFLELYRLFPGLRMEFVSIQWDPAQKVQFYFKIY